MTVWSTPATSTGGSTAVTASFWNVEVRDHLNWLKGFADLITASSAADSGDGTWLSVTRAASGTAGFRAMITGDTQPRILIYSQGKIGWGNGGASAPDVFIERPSGATPYLKITGDTYLRNELSVAPAADTTVFSATVAGDATSRFKVWLRPDHGAGVALSQGSANRSYWYLDETNTNVWFGAPVSGYGLRVTGNTGIYLYDGLPGTMRAAFQPNVADGTSWMLNFGSDTYASIWRSGTSRLTSLGRFAPAEMAIKVKAGVLADGDYSSGAAAESGLIGYDTLNHRLYVRDGSTWRYADFIGSTTEIGVWTWTNLAASTTALLGDIPGPTTGARKYVPWAGSIVGMSVRGNAACTAGTATFKPNVSGSAKTLSVVIDSVTSTLAGSNTQDAGIDTFATNQTIGVEVTTNSAFLPTATTDYAAWLYVVFARTP